MKKVILSVTMVLAAFFTQASVGKKADLRKLTSSEVITLVAARDVASVKLGNALCTVTLKGRIDLGPVEAEVSCTTSASSCDAATVSALSCLSAAMRTVRSVIL